MYQHACKVWVPIQGWGVADVGAHSGLGVARVVDISQYPPSSSDDRSFATAGLRTRLICCYACVSFERFPYAIPPAPTSMPLVTGLLIPFIALRPYPCWPRPRTHDGAYDSAYCSCAPALTDALLSFRGPGLQSPIISDPTFQLGGFG